LRNEPNFLRRKRIGVTLKPAGVEFIDENGVVPMFGFEDLRQSGSSLQVGQQLSRLADRCLGLPALFDRLPGVDPMPQSILIACWRA
jgi:hypothetical protein